MNISKATKQALIPIEREIKFQPVENIYILDNIRGGVCGTTAGRKGNASLSISVSEAESDCLIYTHNHPKALKNNTALSVQDIKTGIINDFREIRAVTKDGFCHLLEIPQVLGINKKNLLFMRAMPNQQQIEQKCLNILDKYQAKFNGNFSWQLYRKMQKELEKLAGLKFRTIKLPEQKIM